MISFFGALQVLLRDRIYPLIMQTNFRRISQVIFKIISLVDGGEQTKLSRIKRQKLDQEENIISLYLSYSALLFGSVAGGILNEILKLLMCLRLNYRQRQFLHDDGDPLHCEA